MGNALCGWPRKVEKRNLSWSCCPGGPGRNQVDDDFSHLGFALESREAVDQLSQKARAEGLLIWEPQDDPYPVGYYCGVKDPDGNFVEFSYGQPLGPGAAE